MTPIRNSNLKLFAAALFATVLFCASAAAQEPLGTFQLGRFHVNDRVCWGKTVLQPGNYVLDANNTHSTPVKMLTVHSADWKQSMMVALARIDDVQPGGSYLTVTPDRTRACLVVSSLNLPYFKANVIFSRSAKHPTPPVGNLVAQIPVTPSGRPGN